jgi:3-methyladenine DNA glycosylase Mpg
MRGRKNLVNNFEIKINNIQYKFNEIPKMTVLLDDVKEEIKCSARLGLRPF